MRPFRRSLGRQAAGRAFQSGAYWRKRYARGGNSGAGSYGRLAAYKADVVNGLVAEKGITSVIEFGSGDGNQCSMLMIARYTGVDVSEMVVHACRVRFADKAEWHFLTEAEYLADRVTAELSMSLDVIYHLVEDHVFDRYMVNLFAASTRFVLVYSSDHDETIQARHVRHRAYSDWVKRHAPEFRLVNAFDHPFPMHDQADPKQTSFAAFKLFEKITGEGAKT